MVAEWWKQWNNDDSLGEGLDMSKSKRRLRSRDTGFYAYSSHYPLQGEVIESAIKQISESPDAGLFIVGWKDTHKESSRIITNILRQIDEADFFLADLSDLNHNVLFELGYAVSRKKPVVLSIQGNSDVERRRAMGDLHVLSTWEVTAVQNAEQLADAIRKFAPGPDRQPELETYSGTGEEPGCYLFLKGETNQEIAVASLAAVRRKALRVLLDDWNEDPVQSFTWYYRAVCQSEVVLALFVDPAWDLAQGSNARFAFVCGLAHGLGKRLAMVGLPGYESVVDYRELMWRIESAASAMSMVKQISRDLERCPRARTTTRGTKTRTRDLALLDFLCNDIGDTLAENEETELGDLFIDTPQFRELLNGRKTLFVGSKGAGKTANFFQARERLALDRSCVVCCVKPIDYKMARLISALGELSDQHAAAAHIAENAWKLVAVSELVDATYKTIGVRPVWVQPTPAERDLVNFWEQNRELITAALQSKLDIAVDWLEQASFNQDNYSQLVHDRFISPANRLLRPLLLGKTCYIMFDNLDNAWDKSQDLRVQARLLFALLGVGRRIQDDLGREATIRIAVFLRRNIVQYHLLDEGREPDKLLAQTSELNWADPDSLVGLIERRVEVACARHGLEPINPWESLFVRQVDGIETKRWIMQSIIPRPRDLISLVRGAFEQAARNGHHSLVEEQDLLRAQKQYSMFALGQMIGEYRSENPWLEDIVSSLAGQNSRITLRELEVSIGQTLGRQRQACLEIDVRSIVTCLVDMGFIGIRFSDEDIRYADTIPDGRLLCQKVRNHPSRVPLHLEVHPVYHRCLSLRRDAAERPKSALEEILSRFGVVKVRSS